MTLDEQITILEHNAEYERTHGSLQGCLDFRQLAEWLAELKHLREQTEPCEDAISRRQAIDEIKRWFDLIKLNPDILIDSIVTLPSVQPEIKCIAKITMTDEQVKEAFEKAKCEILDALPEQRWIPVGERLPEDNLKVFVSTKTAVGIAAHNELGWYVPDTYFDGVIAWMSLPEPYKVEGSESDADCY